MLYKTILANTFGQRSRQPFRAACIRLSGLLLAGNILGVLLTRQISSLPVIFPDSLHVVAMMIIAMQTCGLAALLVMQNMLRASSDTTARLLHTLPLRRRQLWIALLLPTVVILLLTVALVLPSLIILLRENIHPLILSGAVLLGMGNAQLIMLSAPRHRLAPILLSTVITMAEFILLSKVNTPGGNTVAFLAIWVLIASTWYFGIRALRRMPVNSTHQLLPVVIGRLLPPSWWFLKKVARAEITQLGCLSGVVIACSISVAVKLNYGPALYTLPVSLLAAAAVADIRSLCSSHHPAEIMMRGVGYFFRSQLLASAMLGLTVSAPFLFAVLSAGINYVFVLFGYILLGSAIGLFASTVVSPGQRDISGQLLATLLCLGITLAFTVLPPFALLPMPQFIFYCSAAVILALFAAMIEYFRNPVAWRAR